jgi:Mg-chelatase subunit ChlD
MTHSRTAARLFASIALAGLAVAPVLARPGPENAAVPDQKPAPDEGQAGAVDLVICLDNSGSMSGLIDACRKKIWDVCSLLAQAEPSPKLRVALLTYGAGTAVIDSAFTDELDQVYEKLMAVQINGGTELVGGVLHAALTKLQWSTEQGALKMIFVAGNESANQDTQYDFRKQVQEALQQRVVVNAIYCGTDATSGDAATWREIATAGAGEYAAIDQSGTISIVTPFDAEITRLGTKINATYISYGVRGKARAANQEQQDANAGSLGSSTAAARSQMKGGKLYCNGSWDLVDRCAAEDFDWSQIAEKDLPAELKGKTKAEREAFIKKLADQRRVIQDKIAVLGKKRTAFITAELTKRAGENAKSLDFAIAKAVKKAAEARGFSFK